MCALSWLILAATNQEKRHQRLHQQIVLYLCSLQNRLALSYIIIEGYAELLLHSRYSQRFQLRLHPAICQTTAVSSRSMCVADWGERIPKCGLRTKISLYHRACHRLESLIHITHSKLQMQAQSLLCRHRKHTVASEQCALTCSICAYLKIYEIWAKR